MDLLSNPFHILSATPRDNRRRIMDLSDERSLLLDSNQCIQACSDLTNPRKRLAAEVAWLPGLSPKQAEMVMNWLSNPVQKVPSTQTLEALSPLVRGNILASGLMKLANNSNNNIAEWILVLAKAFEEINPDELFRVINEERTVSGFSEVQDMTAIESEIQERRHYYRQVIKSVLDNLSSRDLVDVITIVVDKSTTSGEKHGPILIDDIVDSFEVEAQAFLEKEEANIKTLVDMLRAAADAKRSDSLLSSMV